MLTNFAKLLVSMNGLESGDYVEVYAGGASIAWALLFDGYVKNVHINDLSRPIYAFWRSEKCTSQRLRKKRQPLTPER